MTGKGTAERVPIADETSREFVWEEWMLRTRDKPFRGSRCEGYRQRYARTINLLVREIMVDSRTMQSPGPTVGPLKQPSSSNTSGRLGSVEELLGNNRASLKHQKARRSSYCELNDSSRCVSVSSSSLEPVKDPPRCPEATSLPRLWTKTRAA